MQLVSNDWGNSLAGAAQELATHENNNSWLQESSEKCQLRFG